MESAALYHPGSSDVPSADLYIEHLSHGPIVIVSLAFENGLPQPKAQAEYRNIIGTACLRDPRPQAILQGLNDWAVKERIIVRALVGVVISPRSVHVQIGSAGHTPAFLRGWNAGPGVIEALDLLERRHLGPCKFSMIHKSILL